MHVLIMLGKLRGTGAGEEAFVFLKINIPIER